MMELTCAYLLVLFSLVCATPYGYGVKGGASAKAEASASAGAFDGVRGLPLTIPSGSGFSGSYSKSSSSSFASSSSSASSSASSFSFSGFGSPGFGANIVSGENTGCGSGACSQNKNDQFSNPHGSDASGYSGAHAAAGSKAVTGIYSNGNINSGCGHAGCSKNINGLPSAHVTDGAGSVQGAASNSAAGSNEEAGTYDNKNEGCGSGDCSNKNTNDQLSSSDSNGSLQGYNSANAASKAAAGIPGYTNRGCSSGSCASNKIDGLPNAQGSATTGSSLGHNGANLNAESKPCFGNDCSNRSPTCEGSGCSLNTQTKLPVPPNFGSYDIPAKKYDSKLSSDKALNGYNGANSNCANGNCGIDSPNNYGNKNQYNQVPGVLKCDSPNCNGHDSNAATAFPSSGFGPSKPATYLTTPIASANCNYPGCQPSIPSPGKPSSYNVPLHPSTDLAKDKLPCNDGNCGTNQYKHPYSTGNIGPGAAPSGSTGPITCASPNCAKQPNSSPGLACKSPNCAPNYSSAPTESSAGLNYHPGVSGSVFQPTNPSYVSSAAPSHKPLGGQFNFGCKTPDCVGYTPGHSFTGSPSGSSLNHPVPQFPVGGSSHATPSYTTSVSIPNTPNVGYSPSCKTPNCVPQAPGNTGSYGAAIPVPGVVPQDKEPTAGYTGGFGGPAGFLKPNDYSGPTNTHLVKPSHTGSPNIVKPSEEPSGVELPPYTGGFGGPSGILKPNEVDSKQPLTPTHTPASTVNPSSHINPTYTGGFGAPSGTLKPNEISGIANSNAASGSIATPTTPGQKVPTPFGGFSSPSGTYKPGLGTTIGITPVVHLGTPVILQPISYPTHSSLPVPTGGLGASLVTSQPNTYVTGNPATNPNVHHDGPHEQLPFTGSDGSADKNSPTYTGNFGGAPGGQKPTDLSTNTYSKPSTTTTSGIKPSSCSSGSCGNEAGNAVAVAKADAVAYTGGFGGPPGLLKPHDGGKLDSKLPSAAQFGANHGSAGSAHSGIDSSGIEHKNEGKSPVNGASIQSGAAAQANAVAQATATAGATSGTYGNNNGYRGSHGDVHGNGHKFGTGCGGGCGSGNYHSNGPDFSSSSALSTAKAGALDSADAKSVAGAVSGARAFGGSGSFASSSASAHASAGYATKGGYGK